LPMRVIVVLQVVLLISHSYCTISPRENCNETKKAIRSS